METEYKHSMEQFDWIGKSIIGVLGTSTSVILNNFSEVASILAALFTIAFMIKQIIHLSRKDKRAQEMHEKNIND